MQPSFWTKDYIIAYSHQAQIAVLPNTVLWASGHQDERQSGNSGVVTLLDAEMRVKAKRVWIALSMRVVKYKSLVLILQRFGGRQTYLVVCMQMGAKFYLKTSMCLVLSIICGAVVRYLTVSKCSTVSSCSTVSRCMTSFSWTSWLTRWVWSF